MNICKINTRLIKILFLYIIIFLNYSCSLLKSNEVALPDETIIDSNNYIKTGSIKSFDYINNFWESQNEKSYKIDYDFIEYSKINFGEGKKKHNNIISNPIVVDDYIFLIDNNALLTKYNILSNDIEWQKIIDENIQKNASWPASLVATDKSIIITTGEGSVKCLDFMGNLIWSKNFYMSIRTASYLMNDLVIILINDGELVALNKDTGEKQWSFSKDYEKISSVYGGQIYEYRNHLIVTSPKGDVYFIDNFLNEYSQLETYFHKQFIPINRENFGYDIKISAFKNYLIIIENKNVYSLYDLLKNKFFITRYDLPENKYLTNINNSIILLDKENILRSFNIENGKMFWKLDINEYLKSKNKIINILESEKNIVVFTDNGLCLFLNKDNGILENKLKLKVNNANAVYLHNKYILFVTDKSRLHIYK